VLVAAVGGGAVLGSLVDPNTTTEAPTHADHASDPALSSDADPAEQDEVRGGVTSSRDGFRLELLTSELAGDVPGEVALVIRDREGSPVTAFDVAHEKELHLVVVSRDLASFAHLHPTRDPDGTWRVATPPLPAGSYRVYADVVPSGAANVVLGADLTVPGDHEPRRPAPSRAVTVDGYQVTIDGSLVPGQTSELAVSVRRDGVAVTDLEPYLGALGHLVAIRDGDLAYLHVHPLEQAEGPGGPTVRFGVTVPTAGTYGLFFDFSVGGLVRSASVVTSTDHGEH
jgi:hypothetical protein